MSVPPSQQFSHWPSWPLPILQDIPPKSGTPESAAARVKVSVTSRHPCNYLPGRHSTFRVFDSDKITGPAYQRLMDSGFRRSGTVVYQPMCAGCRECIPIRVPVEKFLPTKSQRRVLKKNADLEVRIAEPQPTREKWELYELYQKEWHGDTTPDARDSANDALSFVTFLYRSPVQTLEFEYRTRSGKLLGIGICDLCPTSLSSVYFYFNPHEKTRSLGTFSALYEINWARRTKLTHWYAGYWLKNCPAMSYKSRFHPYETLGTDGTWRPKRHRAPPTPLNPSAQTHSA